LLVSLLPNFTFDYGFGGRSTIQDLACLRVYVIRTPVVGMAIAILG
jgi:hypothetical protein